MKRSTAILILFFAAAAGLRLLDTIRPINQASWRECDLGGISRNFVLEGMNPLFPRIDWRGDGPGFAEMEFPLYPWLTAVSYELFGVHDQIGRVWSFLFSLAAMLIFYHLARLHLGVFPSIVAFVFFAFHPLIVGISTSIQPEGLMMCSYLAAVFYFLRWLRSERDADLWLCTVATAVSLLAKAPAAHLGLFFGILLLFNYGAKVFFKPKIWIFGIVSVVPAAIWYSHAKNLWLTYGNSLGVSNEYHWIGFDFFTDPHFIQGMFRIEFASVWLLFGVVAGVFAVWRGIREPAAWQTLIWLASIILFYLIAARTTSEEWAMYYHVFSIPPVALLIGLSVKKLFEFGKDFGDKYSERSPALRVIYIGVAFAVVISLVGSFRTEAKQIVANYQENHIDKPAFVFAKQSRPMLGNSGLILVSGGFCRDPKGYQVAYNASYMFYWLGRKGWNICVEDQSEARLAEFAERGAKYFVAETRYLSEVPGFEDALNRSHPVIARSDGFVIYDLMEQKDK